MEAGTDEVSSAVVARLVERIDAIADTMVATYRQHISDYGRLTSPEFDRDVRSMSVKNLESLLAHLEHGRLLDDDELADIRASAARRVHQGVPLDALLHAYRLWGELAWEEIVAATASEDLAARDTAMRMAGRLIQQLNLVSTELTRGYLTESEGVRSDEDALRRELVEVLVAAPEDRDRAVRLADALALPLAPSYVAIVAGLAADAAAGRLDRAAANRRAAARARQVIGSRSAAAEVLVTVRHEYVVVLVPDASPRDATAIAGDLAAELGPLGYAVGVGGIHDDLEGTRTAYREAAEALDVAIASGATGEPTEFERVLVDAILRQSPLTARLVTAVFEPLRRHDVERAGELADTLTAFIDSGFSVARAARRLNAHANTVTYRLQRIHELTGHDPRRADDLATLVLAVRASRALGDGA
jgi:DNA-binding PucR family transcriptional regulator